MRQSPTRPACQPAFLGIQPGINDPTATGDVDDELALCAAERAAPEPEPPARGRSLLALTLATAAPVLTGLAGLAGLGVATAPAASAAPGTCVTTSLLTTCTFSYTGDSQDWKVPSGIRRATFTVTGAAGGNAGGQSGGRGGGVISTVTTTPGDTYRLYVGGRGSNYGVGGWNGGGNGAGVHNPNGGGGGGASEIRVVPFGNNDVLMVGGGGGGAGSQVLAYMPQPDRRAAGAGGDGGTSADARAGQPGGSVDWNWAGVGAGGGGGGSSTGAGPGGGRSAGTLMEACGWFGIAVSNPGAAGAGRRGGAGGSLTSLWTNARCDSAGGWGGGGGGGWYAGGGGGGGTTAGAGGGGGSSYAPGGSSSSLGQPESHGLIKISYVTPGDWFGLGGGTVTSAPTVAVRPGTGLPMPDHDVFYLNQFGNVTQRVVDDGAPGPEHNLGAVLYPGSTVAAVWSTDGQRLDLLGRGTESALWQKTFTFARGWGSWFPRTDEGALTSDPTVVSLRPGDLDVFYRGVSNQLVQLPILNGAPQQPIERGGNLSTAPSAAVAVAGRIDVVASTQGQLHWWTYTTGTWTDNGLVTKIGATTSAPQLSSYVRDYLDVAVRGQSGDLVRADAKVGDTWNVMHLPVPSPAGSAVAAVPAPSGSLINYARGTQSNLIARVFVVGS